MTSYLFLDVGPLAGVGHVCLGLPELGQVEGCYLLRLLNLLLVGADLGLQLVNQTLGVHQTVRLVLLFTCSFN